LDIDGGSSYVCGYNWVVDSSRPRHSLADDPKFQDSLSELDRGLGVDQATDERLSDSEPAAAAPLPVDSPETTPSAAERTSRRPLIDLFPSPPVSEPPRVPLRGVAAPPRLARANARRVPPSPDREPDRLTYETFYGLSETPFGADPDPRFLYHSAAHDTAAQELREAIRRREGVAVVTGPRGIGKTMLCLVVLDQLDRRTVTSFVAAPASLGDLMATVLVDVGVLSGNELAQRRTADAADLTKTLRSFVASLASLQANAVVVIDDAHQLPGEVLRNLHQLTDGITSTLQLVLVGEPELVAQLDERRVRTLRDAITCRSELKGLLVDEIPGYVMRRLAVAGEQPRIEFEDSALRLLFELSGGNPQAVNLVCHRALTRAFGVSASVIDSPAIQAAAGELELSAPVRGAQHIVRALAAAVVLLVLMAAGAAGAAWMFRDRLDAAISAWESIPLPPAEPLFAVPKPIVPIPPPDESPAI
jgi:type II secretory pathway predicted ATPase ExeA